MRRVLSGAIVSIVLIIAPQALAADGQAVYTQNCAVCHNNLDPKLSDKAAWAPRIKQGDDALVAAVISGKGAMPARAGKPALSDDDIKAAVEYIESKVK
jgi:cytochrome c5